MFHALSSQDGFRSTSPVSASPEDLRLELGADVDVRTHRAARRAASRRRAVHIMDAALPRPATGRKTLMPGHLRIAVLGSRSAFTRHAVDALCESGIPPVALMVDAVPVPRAGSPIPVEVRESTGVAETHGVELVPVPDPNHPDAIATLERIEPDLLLLACLPHVVGRATRETARLGALNLHPSALPRFRGPDPVFWQLRAGVARAGVTVHVATGAVDAGPIVARRWLEVRPGIGAEALTAALVRLGVQALVETLPALERRMHEAVPQDESAATRQFRPHRDDFRLDTTWTAERAYRFIEGTRGPATAFTIAIGGGEDENKGRGENKGEGENEIVVERAIGFDPVSRGEPTVVHSGGVVAIRFAEGVLRAIPSPPARRRQPRR